MSISWTYWGPSSFPASGNRRKQCWPLNSAMNVLMGRPRSQDTGLSAWEEAVLAGKWKTFAIPHFLFIHSHQKLNFSGKKKEKEKHPFPLYMSAFGRHRVSQSAPTHCLGYGVASQCHSGRVTISTHLTPLAASPFGKLPIAVKYSVLTSTINMHFL